MNRRSIKGLGMIVASALSIAGTAVAERGTARAPDGIPIVYEVEGAGEPALVLIHCWSCDRGFWAETMRGFAANHRVVALDLPGHGESGTGRREWTIQAFGADVAAVAAALDLKRMVLIGHSMGGPVALEAARLLPGRVVGVVAVDTLHDADWKPDEKQWHELVAGFERDFATACSGFVASMFPPGVDPELLSSVSGRMCDAPPEIALTLLRAAVSYQLGNALRASGVPIRAINSTGFPTNVAGNRRFAVDFSVLIMDGVGHFLHLERPEEFQFRLAAVLAELAGGPPAVTSPAAARLADFAWLTGSWREQGEGSLSEEVWSAPAGDSMLGMWRFVGAGRAKVFELLAIRREAEAPVFLLRHFDPSFSAWEEKEAPLRLPLVRWAASEAVFEGQGSDGVAVRLTYRQPESEALEVLLEHGAERHQFLFRRE